MVNFVSILLFSTLSASLASANTNSIIDDHELYSKLYPNHIEYCAATRYKEQAGPTGGYGGHAITYIHGLCRDENSEYPRVRLCRSDEEEQGVGISVNSDFKNVNWVAIPNYHLFFDGNLKNGETVNLDLVKSLSKNISEKGYFKNIVVKPAVTGNAIFGSAEYEYAVAKSSLGTDFALRFARTLRCARVPILAESLPEIAKNLNQLNEYYYVQKHEYTWDMFNNNCTHTANEILKGAGMHSTIKSNLNLPNSLLNMAIPKNTLFTIIQKTVLASPKPWLVLNEENFSAFDQRLWVLPQVGAMAKKYQGFKDNSFFSISERGFWILPKDSENFYQASVAYKEKEYSDIYENLKYWKKKYQEVDAIFKNKNSSWRQLQYRIESNLVYGSETYLQFEPIYQNYINEQKLKIQNLLQKI